MNPAPSKDFGNSAPVPAIVLASGLNGLCTVRSLGAAGVSSWAIVTGMHQPCARSRFTRPFERKPREKLMDLLTRLQREEGVESGVLIATSDDSARELAEAALVLPQQFRFAGPGAHIVALLMDKRQEVEALAAVTDSLPTSLAVLPHTKHAILEHLRLPIIFKPRTQQVADVLRMKNRVVHSDDEVEQFLGQFADALDLFVAQEVIPGGDDTIWQCNAVFNERHELVSAFTFQKLGMSPPHYGVTTMGRSVRNEEVVALVREIGLAIGYVGPAGFEFKRDARDGRYRYIEINPRHGMTNWFDTCCGVNTSLRTYRLALGDQDHVIPPQQRECVFVDVYADLFSRLVDDGEPVSTVVRRYAKLMQQSRIPAYWMWSDPVPGFAALSRNAAKSLQSATRLMRRLMPKGRIGPATPAPERPRAP